MWLQNTNEILKTFNGFYNDNYKNVFNKYKVELEFATILTYYSGSCAFVIDIASTPDANAVTDMCMMIECVESDLQELTETVLHTFFREKIINKYQGLLEFNMLVCSRNINRKVIIKNTNYNEEILNIKLDKESIQIELNYNKISVMNKTDKDLSKLIEGLAEHLELLA